jgi:hypothetical protein
MQIKQTNYYLKINACAAIKGSPAFRLYCAGFALLAGTRFNQVY